MLYFRIRNFEKFQHYHDRKPPWIKLYWDLFLDRNFYRLDSSTKFFVIALFSIASRCDNKIPFDEQWICDQINYDKAPDWQIILDSGFIIPIDCNASTLLASCKHVASLEKRRDREETETEILSISPKNAKSSLKECSEIFKCWNVQSATMHHRSLNGQEKAIIKTLRKYSPEEVCRAIERYSQVRANVEGRYRDLYAWTLGEFVTRKDHYNIERFNAENWEQPFLVQTKTHQESIFDRIAREQANGK